MKHSSTYIQIPVSSPRYTSVHNTSSSADFAVSVLYFQVISFLLVKDILVTVSFLLDVVQRELLRVTTTFSVLCQ